MSRNKLKAHTQRRNRRDVMEKTAKQCRAVESGGTQCELLEGHEGHHNISEEIIARRLGWAIPAAALHESVARAEQVCANPSCGHSESTHNDGFGGCTARYYPEDSDNPNSQCICDHFQKAQPEPERGTAPREMLLFAEQKGRDHDGFRANNLEVIVQACWDWMKLAPSPLPVREQTIMVERKKMEHILFVLDDATRSIGPRKDEIRDMIKSILAIAGEKDSQ